MSFLRKITREAVVLSLFFINTVDSLALPKTEPHIFFKKGDFKISTIGLIRNESESDIYTTLLRSNIHDKLFYNRTTLDFTVVAEDQAAAFHSTLRDRIVWANHKTINTDRTYLTTLDAIPTVHAHNIGQNMLWFREIWMQADMSTLCATELPPLKITLGAFSFKLGRGIALGDAYRVNSLAIDFFQDSVVDQYPWGAKISGQLTHQNFNYDVYLGILNNYTTDLEETNFPTRIYTFGTSNTSKVRGAGQIQYILGGHCLFAPIKSDTRVLTFDPYIMHYNDPQQRVDNLYDAKMSLTTPGFAVELVTEHFEFGFDCAYNFGHQSVLGWDNNVVRNVDSGGYSAYYYTDVVKVNPNIQEPTETDYVLFEPENTQQVQAIAQVTPGTISNGTPIAGTPYYNSLTRYRGAYKTKLKGYMWIGDASVWLVPKNLKLSATWGIASGDANPNGIEGDRFAASVDKVYNGFVPVQELYAGNRVQSYFYMASGLTPLLSSNNIDSYFTYAVDALSNVIFWGSSLKYEPQAAKRKWYVMSDLIMYWADYKNKKFNLATGLTTNQDASAYKGLEANSFLSVQISENTSIVAGLAMFVPGDYYFDIFGMPLSFNARQALLNALKSGASITDLPLLGDSTGYSGIVAMLYTF